MATRTKHIALKPHSPQAEVAALCDDEKAIVFLQRIYGLERDQAEAMLREIDLLCEGLIEIS